MDTSKRCTKCNEVKPLDNDHFRKQSSTKDGFKYVCISCDDDAQKERYARKKYDYIEKVKQWQLQNIDKVKQYKKISKPQNS